MAFLQGRDYEEAERVAMLPVLFDHPSNKIKFSCLIFRGGTDDCIKALIVAEPINRRSVRVQNRYIELIAINIREGNGSRGPSN